MGEGCNTHGYMRNAYKILVEELELKREESSWET
jgi:hypothetical protein